MDNKATLLGIVHFKKTNNIKSNIFTISYLSSNGDYKIKLIKGYANNDILENITNGMLVILSGQILYSEDKDKFIIRVDNILPIKDRSGLAEDTIILQYGNYHNQLVLNTYVKDVETIKTHPKPIPGDITYNGELNIKGLDRLGLVINKQLNYNEVF